MKIIEKVTRDREPWKAFQVRQRNTEIKRDAVLQTAAQLFLEAGYRRTSMRELAARLKITKPALYYYFRNKEEILVECYRAGIASIEGLLDVAVVSDSDGLTKVQALVKAYATAIVTFDFGRCVATLDDSELSSKTRHEVRALKRRIDSSIRQYIDEGIADGSISACNAKLASFAIAGAINWIGVWYKPDGALGASEISSEFARLLTRGLARGDGETSQLTAPAFEARRTRARK
jgi:AcrR family transcriptional regulator